MGASSVCANNIKVVMNSTSPFMSLKDKATGELVDVGTPEARTYNFEAAPGTYVLTGYASDETTVSGTIELNVTDDSQEFTVFTCTTYATNMVNGNFNQYWTADVDYTVEAEVVTREGVSLVITVGNSTTAGRKCFLALNGNSYYVSLIPSAEHQAEGYMTLYKSGTLTAGVNIPGIIPQGKDYSITLPQDAELQLFMKFAHYIPFRKVEPQSVTTEGGKKVVTYHLADHQVYNYRTWKEGGLTQGGYFTMYSDEQTCPAISFSDADYEAFGQKTIKHDVTWNGGYETGDILVNINERGHLKMHVGETYDAHAMRSWQLTDTQTNNYFIEPDFHYTVIGLDGKPSTGVIEIDNANTTVSPWSTIKAVGNGTAIVLVTYDAIGLNYYNIDYTTNSPKKNAYMGGEYWSAIWPENTAAYVVTVDEGETSMQPNMLINEAYNDGMKKNAGKYVDAEHDVFYYLDTEEGFTYSFTPEGVAKVEIAYPVIGTEMATYNGFATAGVTQNADGSYSLLLKEGRQIVRLTDANGNSVYQVLTAKKCHRDIINASRPGSNIFQPGDQVKIQYSGLRHPANKLSGIYNMSAYVTYNGIPNGSSLILGAGQYTFGSAASAQAVTIDIPADYDVAASPELVMNEGVIQVNGYGDPIGNHRLIDKFGGRSANFTAVAHKTYFGAIPDVRIPITDVRNFTIRMVSNVEGAHYTVTTNGKKLEANADGTYTGTYGNYVITAAKAGYRCYRSKFNIADDAEGEQVVNVELQKAASDDAWDGETLTEPTITDGTYMIGTGAEMAWFANKVNESKGSVLNAELTADIDLADYDWTPVGGNARATAYKGTFNGNGHTISGVYIATNTENQGFFAYVQNASITGLTLEGTVTSKQFVGGIVGYAGEEVTIDRCVNRASVKAMTAYAGGIVAYLSAYNSVVTNSYNEGTVTTPTNAGGVVGTNFMAAQVMNVFNVGTIACPTAAASCVGGTTKKTNVTGAYGIGEYSITDGNIIVTEEQMASGEIAYKLGEAFGQEIGKDLHPVLGGMEVLYDEATDRYYNEGVDGIEEITVGTTNSRSMVFDTLGRKHDGLHKGLNIIVDSMGKVKKIMK